MINTCILILCIHLNPSQYFHIFLKWCVFICLASESCLLFVWSGLVCSSIWRLTIHFHMQFICISYIKENVNLVFTSAHFIVNGTCSVHKLRCRSSINQSPVFIIFDLYAHCTQEGAGKNNGQCHDRKCWTVKENNKQMGIWKYIGWVLHPCGFHFLIKQKQLKDKYSFRQTAVIIKPAYHSNAASRQSFNLPIPVYILPGRLTTPFPFLW